MVSLSKMSLHPPPHYLSHSTSENRTFFDIYVNSIYALISDSLSDTLAGRMSGLHRTPWFSGRAKFGGFFNFDDYKSQYNNIIHPA